MAKTQYPDLTIRDDWNDRLPQPVTSFADDVAKAGNTPNADVKYDPTFVETSAGAVPADSDTAKAAADVAMKEPKEPAADENDAATDEKPVDTAPDATRVSRTRNTGS